MTAEQLQRVIDLSMEVRNTDDLYGLELRTGPYDEEDPVAARALFHLAAVRCRLARGPAPSPSGFLLARPAPDSPREWFEMRGRMGSRIVRVGWADGVLYGSLHAIRHLEGRDACCDPVVTRQHLVGLFDVVIDEVRALAVA